MMMRHLPINNKNIPKVLISISVIVFFTITLTLIHFVINNNQVDNQYKYKSDLGIQKNNDTNLVTNNNQFYSLSSEEDIKILDSTNLDVVNNQSHNQVKNVQKVNTKTTFELEFHSTTSISSSGDESSVQKYTLDSLKSHALSFRFPKNISFEFSFDGDEFILIEADEEGLISNEFSYSSLIYSHESWSGDFYIRADSGFNFTIYLVPDSLQGVKGINNYSTQSLSPSDYSGAMSTNLNIIPRSVWGANTSGWDPNDTSDINSFSRLVWDVEYFRPDKIAVHHTATPYTTDPSQAIRDIYLYHTYSRGWGDIGYNYLIDQDGNIYEGKIGGEGVFSYHAYREANELSLSIALIGDFTNYGPTAQAKNSLAMLIAEKSIFYDFPITVTDGSQTDWLSEDITLYGHKTTFVWCYDGHPLDYLCTDGSKWVQNPTACPGAMFYPILTSEIYNSALSYRSDSTFNQLKNIVSTIENSSSTGIDTKSGELILIYESELNQTIVDSLVPNYSGITSKVIDGNRLILSIEDWDNGGHVPQFGWRGWNTSHLSSNIDWRDERVKILQKVFTLSGEWESVLNNNNYSIF